MLADDEEARGRPSQPKRLDTLGLAELDAYVAELQAEIARVEAEIVRKRGSRDAASSIFRQ